MPRTEPTDVAAADRAVHAGAEEAFAFPERATAAPGTAGQEAGALAAGEPARLGSGVRAVPVLPAGPGEQGSPGGAR